MKQKEKRLHVMCLTYLSDFYDRADLEEEVDFYLEDFVKEESMKVYIKERFYSLYEKLGVIDPMIASIANGWKLERMAKVDLAIMRLAAFEMFFDENIPSEIAISEAVLLAKTYGGDEGSPAFINGILGRLNKNKLGNE